jgi:hypothetical protein
VLALSAPNADQFVGNSFELAKLAQPSRKVDFQAPVVMAAAPAPVRRAIDDASADDGDTAVAAGPTSTTLLHQASLKTETREVPAKAAAPLPRTAAPQSSGRPVTAAKPAKIASLDKPGLAAAKSATKPSTKAPAAGLDKKVVDKLSATASKPVTKPVRVAKVEASATRAAKPAKPSKELAAAR